MKPSCHGKHPWQVAWVFALVLGALVLGPAAIAASQELLWENKGQATYGGFFSDVATEGRVVVTNGAAFDDQFRYRWFVRAQDRRTGETLWEDQLDPDIAVFDGANKVAVDQGRAFVAGFILREPPGYFFAVRAYDLKTGALLWDQRVSRMLGGDTAKVLAARNGRVFVGGYLLEEIGGFNYAVLAFDGRTGTLLWESVLDSGPNDAAWSIAASGDGVFVAGDAGAPRAIVIRALHARNGAVLWEKIVEGASFSFEPEEDALDVSGRLVFVAGMLEDGDFIIHAYKARSGALAWSARVEAGNRISQGVHLATSNGRLFAAGALDCDPATFVECKLVLHAYDASTGVLLWSDLNQSPGNDWYVQGLTAGAGRVFVGGARLNEAGDYTAAFRTYDARTGVLKGEETFDGGGAAFEGVYDLFWDRGRLFALGQLSNPDKHSDAFVRAYRVGSHHAGHHGDGHEGPDDREE